jgi:hypothetical protein
VDKNTGRQRWRVERPEITRGYATPVIAGDMIYVHSWETGGEVETPTETLSFEATLEQYDTNHDGKLTPEELPDRMRNSFVDLDLNRDGAVDRREWDFYSARRAARNSLLAIRYGGRGDLTTTDVVWSMQKFLPNVPSPLLCDGVLYIVKDGGILTSIDPTAGKILKEARLAGTPGTYYSPRVAATARSTKSAWRERSA